MRNLVVVGGSSHPELTAAICSRLGIAPGQAKLSKFSNKETSVEMKESVRGQDVYIIQSGCSSVNDAVFELLIMINACKIASAKRITAVLPYFPYSRQADVPFRPSSGAPLERLPPATPKTSAVVEPSTDDVSKLLRQKLSMAASGGGRNGSDYRQWVAQPGTLVANLLTCSGADHIVTMEMHDAQFQGFFDCPVDNLLSRPLLIKYIRHCIPQYENAVIVSPDAGGAKRATAIAETLQMDFALIHKERRLTPTKRELMLVGDVRGKVCILIDDICDTSYTITRAARMLRENGAVKIYALVCHAILSGNAVQNIENSELDQVIVSNTIPQHLSRQQCSKIKMYDVAPMFAEAIRRIHFGESVSMLLDAHQEYF
ncbi:hypothetical protein O0I10_007552 [Lichtheimia ornata]|uniref:ribose-phosphate diphosphokinase n=1 Tax=Lichtheimia ornata TaxID=688661 RepID=A0AAD7XW56_9FUNG|nr:uncharacterized protein O0I10_007552 [Lichtheimia ornata]KAJ8656705.1 hypothetical protein O0I10_007552 [Lichtheimia ornata]